MDIFGRRSDKGVVSILKLRHNWFNYLDPEIFFEPALDFEPIVKILATPGLDNHLAVLVNALLPVYRRHRVVRVMMNFAIMDLQLK